MNHRAFALVLLLLSLLLSTSLSDDHARRARMLGGREAQGNQFPYQVALIVGGQFYCGGSIIHERFVVTAAHCMFDRNDNFMSYSVRVIAGVTNVWSNAPSRVEVSAETVYIPRDYSFAASWYNGGHISGDIAILKLSRPLNIYTNPNLKKLEPPEAVSYWGERALITGFGDNWVRVTRNPRTGELERGPGKTDGGLRYSLTTVVNNAECGAKYNRPPMPKSLVCAQTIQQPWNKPGGICGGDSGGPLVVNGNVLIGIVSISPTECREHTQPTIYTRVSYWRDFIEDVIMGRIKPNIVVTELSAY